MTKRKEALDNLFNCYVREGKELGIIEAKRLYPAEVSKVRKVLAGDDMRSIFLRMRKIYANRWHEIYKVNLVQEKPEKVSEPVKDPLEGLKTASRKR